MNNWYTTLMPQRKFKHDAQLSQRYCAAGCVSFGQKWETGTGRQYFTDIILLSIYLSIHCDIIGLQSYRIRRKKTQNKGYYTVQGHRGP